MDDYEKPKRPRTRSLIHGRAVSGKSTTERHAEQVNDPSDEHCAHTGLRNHQSTLLAGKRRNAAHTTCRSGIDQTAHYDTKSKRSHVNIGHVPTQVIWHLFPEHFASSDNEPAFLFPASLDVFFFFSHSSDQSAGKTKRGWAHTHTQNQWLHSCGR